MTDNYWEGYSLRAEDDAYRTPEGVEKYPWISIEDRMPPEDENWVLVYADGAINCMAWCKNEWDDWTASRNMNVNVDYITHWMPLPYPPEGEIE